MGSPVFLGDRNLPPNKVHQENIGQTATFQSAGCHSYRRRRYVAMWWLTPQRLGHHWVGWGWMFGVRLAPTRWAVIKLGLAPLARPLYNRGYIVGAHLVRYIRIIPRLNILRYLLRCPGCDVLGFLFVIESPGALIRV